MTNKPNPNGERRATNPTAEQKAFDLSHPALSGPVIGRANSAIMEALLRTNWPTGRIAVIGPSGSGKSAMARALLGAGAAALGTAEQTKKLMTGSNAPILVLDNFGRFIAGQDAEEAFFHLLNRTAESHQKLVIFSQKALSDIPIELSDLRSRLATFESFEIGLPDDQMMAQLLAKGFEARGVIVAADVIDYLVKRMERSYQAILHAVEILDAQSLKAKSKINKALARQYLEQGAK